MKNLRWSVLAVVLFGATLSLEGWSGLTDLSHQREWKASSVDGDVGELDGVRVAVREVRAAVVDNKPDRGLLFVRVELQGPPASMASWVNCDVSLQASDGRRWLPVYGYAVRGAIKALASDGKDNGNCRLAGVNEKSGTHFDQIYRLPTSVLDDLTVHVSGYGARPAALVFAVKPEVRTFKSP